MRHFYINIKSITLPLLLAIGGCASVMLGTYQDISVETKCDGKPVNAECTMTNEIGSWSVNTPGTLRLHKGFDELELSCKGADFDLHRVKISSSSNLTFYANAFVGGGLGALVDLESKAGFEYPTKITFIVKSCDKPFDAKTDESKNNSQSKPAESAQSYPVSTGVVNKDYLKKSLKENSKDTDTDKTDSMHSDQSKKETAKSKPVPYCKQVDKEIPGCTFQ
jgi:hypothetical protein